MLCIELVNLGVSQAFVLGDFDQQVGDIGLDGLE